MNVHCKIIYNSEKIEINVKSRLQVKTYIKSFDGMEWNDFNDV